MDLGWLLGLPPLEGIPHYLEDKLWQKIDSQSDF